jgi:class 3 adenylate cyclase/tetratricopeptide (TPR) repeat protein
VVACPRCAAENPDTAKFCSECGAALATAPAREQRKVVTVLFCDVSGSTSLAERIDPEALRGVMARYFDTARAAIERHGGTVEKFIGDAVMAVFGVPTVHEDDALRAVRAAVELRDLVEIDVRIGVNTGEVVTGGADTLATGEAVNVAARLEQAASTGDVLIGEETYRLVREAVDAELLPPLEAKGKIEPVTAYRLLAVTGELRRRGGAAMIGRDRELDLLRRAYERTVHEHACHLFTVLGTAGIGKSRLVEEFLADLPGARIVRGRCLSYGEGITYWPVVEILKQLETLPEDEAVRRPLAALLGEEDARTSPPETAWAVRKTLEAAALDGPLVVVFDDMHWGEPTFLDLVEHVADLSRGAPILLLCMVRPELLDNRPGWGGGKHNATSVLLEPLGRLETNELVRRLLGDDDDRLVARIGDAADGNPLFVEEMVELARDSGGEVSVPPTIQALLAARLDSLPLAERSVLERGAVEGQVFHRGAVAALVPEEPQVDSRLVALVRKELVRPDTPTLPRDDAYRFRHLLIRDAAYDALPKAVRIELHERFAAWLDEHGAGLVELDEIVGYHLEQAVRYGDELGAPDAERAARAAARLAAAARRADARSDAAAALNLVTRAVALLPAGDSGRIELLPLLGKALYDSGRLEESGEVLTEAVDKGTGAVSAWARVLRVRARGLGAAVTYEWMEQELETATAELEQLGDDVALADAHSAVALNEYWQGRIGSARIAALRALDYARRAGSVQQEAAATEQLMVTLAWSDAPWPEVERFASAAFADARLGTRTRGAALRTLARVAAARGQFVEARSLYAESLRLFEEVGFPVFAASTFLTLAETEWLVSDWPAMERAAREAWERLGGLGERGIRSTVGGVLSEALARLGRPDEAESIAAMAEEIMTPSDFATEFALLTARSLIAGHAADHDRAVALAEETVALMDAHEYVEMRARARVVLTEVLVACGRTAEAEQAIADAVSLYERKGSVAGVERAQSVLAAAPRQ